MPGVPSGRGCDNCRKSKKKCDEVKPVCTRCARRGIECIGAGEKRYKFMEEGPATIAKRRSPKRHVVAPTKDSKDLVRSATFAPNPMTKAQLLGQGLVAAITPQTSLRYNLMWAYGGYLMLVPRRLGLNDALDTAIDALISTHQTYASCKEVTATSLTKYSNALGALRRCLSNPATASSSETLCAVSVLLVVQHLLGPAELKWTGHAEGAARILKARKSCAPRDAFERILLLSLRGPVLFEGLFNPNIDLSQEEWKELVVNELDSMAPEGMALRYLAEMRDILHRCRTNPDGLAGLIILQAEMKSLYTKTRTIVNLFGVELAEIESSKPGQAPNPLGLPPTWLHAHIQRLYGLCIIIALYMNYALVAMKTDDPELVTDANYLAIEMINIAENALQYRPFGGSYVTMGLVAALMVTDDPKLQALLKGWLEDYREDFDMPYLDTDQVTHSFSRLDPFRDDSPGEVHLNTEQTLYGNSSSSVRVKEEDSPRIIEIPG
ncbi:Zn(II)2Cys6 transcription factor domain-containing protein [Aspergillus stella-maris]|uniref:Zn(II)2Cys6 transcription factor domain-containing protein n=1 Tax=Aspergillus stella-maris TaxID=1810926 RepID=UPI003CCDEBFD